MKRYLAGGVVVVSAVAGLGWLYRGSSAPPSPSSYLSERPAPAPSQPATPQPAAASTSPVPTTPTVPPSSSPSASSAPPAAMELKPSPHAVPATVMQQLPKNHHVLAFTSSDFNGDGLRDFVVVLGRDDEKKGLNPGATEPAPKRPLMVFVQGASEAFVLNARNDQAVYTADQGGQCDPFLDGSEKLAAKGEFFTVQNGVACGQHWTDYITFKYSPELGKFLFHKRIFESLELNRSGSGPALVPGQRTVTTAQKAQPVLLENYAPAR